MLMTPTPILLKMSEEIPEPKHGLTGMAEEFFKKVLEPKFLQAREAETYLIVDLDGTLGYSNGFLAIVFGTLEIQYPGARDNIMFISLDEPYLVSDIRTIFDEVYQ